MTPTPPKLFLRFFRWFCHPELKKYIEGDLMELYDERVKEYGKRKADTRFVIDVLLLFRPGIIRPANNNYYHVTNYAMFKSYFKIGWRNLLRDKGYSAINIGGLAVGMAVAILIGLWVWDELSFDKHHKNYERVAIVLQNQTYGDRVETFSSQSLRLGDELRNNYGSNFRHVVMSSFTQAPILSYGDKAITKTGYFMEDGAPEMLTLTMRKGTRTALKDRRSILLAASAATALFGEEEPLGKLLRIDNQFDVQVAGVYDDLPDNSSFNDLFFIAPLELLVNSGNRNLGWVNNWLMALVQLEDNTDWHRASVAIKDAKLKNVGPDLAKFKPELFLHPMSQWRLYSDFANGVNTGGYIIFIWLFSIIGGFVLLLSCINFMNLSTARSEKRSKEVGIRKVVGSVRSQLIGQFLTESFVFVAMAFVLSLVLVQLALPWFNAIANKKITVAWTNEWLWLFSLAVVLITALVSGSYPSFYLSAFNAGKVLKGTFRAGRYASLPRKALVVVQFSVSVILMIGTVVVYQQIQFAKNRPIGYDRNKLLTVPIKTAEVRNHFEVLRGELLAKNIVSEVSMSECEVTDMWWSDGGLEWKGKDPSMQDIVYRGAVSHGFGKTVGWNIKEGRDFSFEMSSDSLAMILNEAAVEYMGLENPVGETIKLYGRNYTVIGVVENMISQSLYSPVNQTYFIIELFDRYRFINIRLNEHISANEALAAIEEVFKKHNSSTPFEYKFIDEQFSNKFANEERIGKLAGVFAALAILISCLGLFGLASFVAEQRTKEIGIRKVMGASVFSLWKMLSKDFVVLIVLSCLIAIPVAYHFLTVWLNDYEYHTELSWWIFGVTVVVALVITLLTVSFQAVKAAMMNPVKSLRSE